MKNPFKYWGMLIGGKHKTRSFLEGVVESVRKRLGKWKDKLISMVGRLCLIKLMLSSLTTSKVPNVPVNDHGPKFVKGPNPAS